MTTYTQDALGGNVGILYQDHTRVTYTFDPAGQQTTMQDVTGVTSYTHDSAGRQASVVNPTGKALTYSFDSVGNRVGMVDPDGGLTTYSWDAQGRLAGIVNPFAEFTTISYDPLDRESVKVVGNGMMHSHTYDPAGRETALEVLKADGTPLAWFTGTYDGVGNRLTQAELDGTLLTFAYDPAYQLINEQRNGANGYNTSYLYDPAGNRLVKNDDGALTTHLYNSADQLLTVTPPSGEVTTSTWDANGNLATEKASNGLVTTYSWDEENRLAQITYPGGGFERSTYAADGLRRKKETDSTTKNFVWDYVNLLKETDASGVTQAHYTDFPGYWGGLASMRRGDTSSYYVFDLQSNTRLLTDILASITDSYAYKAFGEEWYATGATDNPLRFVGRYGYWRHMAEPVYVRMRHLSVVLGRWLSRDPLERWPTRYAYVASRPTTLADPSGLLVACISLGPWVGYAGGLGSLYGCYGYLCLEVDRCRPRLRYVSICIDCDCYGLGGGAGVDLGICVARAIDDLVGGSQASVGVPGTFFSFGVSWSPWQGCLQGAAGVGSLLVAKCSCRGTLYDGPPPAPAPPRPPAPPFSGPLGPIYTPDPKDPRFPSDPNKLLFPERSAF